MTEDLRGGTIAASSDVLVQELPDDELVFLNLETEEYFGLDRVGAAMYRALIDCGSFDAALSRLLAEFDVDGDRLRRDLYQVTTRLFERGLLERRGA